LAVEQLDEDAGLAAGRVGDAGGTGPRGRGQFGADAVAVHGRVVAGRRLLTAVVDRFQVRTRVAGRYPAGQRQDRDVAVPGTARSAHVGEREAAEVRVPVVVSAAVVPVLRLRAPLDHPERDVRPGERVEATGGTDERVDEG